MTTVGLVGGLGPESTIDYYRRIIAGWEQLHPGSAPSIVIDSLDAKRALKLAGSDRQGFFDYLAESIQRLARAGSTFVAMAANTAHMVFDELAAASPVPLVSIVETCAREAQRRGVQRPALLGTRFTMEASFYPEVFARFGMTIVTPTEAERVALHARYVDELLEGVFTDDTRDMVTALVSGLRTDERADAVILGGTELPLLLRSDTVAGIPMLDTTALHVAAIVELLQRVP